MDPNGSHLHCHNLNELQLEEQIFPQSAFLQKQQGRKMAALLCDPIIKVEIVMIG